jgi:CRP/FNR family cyclic AMP-dependent transcriptional regulator
VSESTTYFEMFATETDSVDVAAGEDVFGAGDPADCFYVVRTGTIRIHDDGVELETIRRGGIFGEMALVDGRPRSATATAPDDATVVRIDERRFQSLVQRTPYFAQEVMRVMAVRLRRGSAGSA